MKFFLTLDIGTTSVKVCALDESFRIHKRVGIEYALISKNNRVELEPGIYIDAVSRGISEVAEEIGGGRVIGISVTTQGETLIPIDACGNALYNAVVWLDARAAEQAEQINGLIPAEQFYMRTGIPECNGLCPISKLLWFKQHEAGIYEKTQYFLLLEDYIILHLTGRFVTEKSLLSTTGYFDITTDSLWTGIFDKLGLDSGKIPTVMDCGEIVGGILPDVAEKLGLSKEIKIVTGAMDQVCGAIGAGNFKSGVVTETTGTALCIGITRKSAPVQAEYNVPIYRHYTRNLQLLLPVCMTAGMALKWFKDVFCAEEEKKAAQDGESVYDYLVDLAAKSPPLSNGIITLPYFSGSLQPLNAPDCRASFSGVGLHCTKPDFIRSILEGVGYMLKENVVMLENITGGRVERIISMGGGARSKLWCEIKSNIMGIPVEVYPESETASQGAAMLCAVAVGVYGSLVEAFEQVQTEAAAFIPQPDTAKQYKKGFDKYLTAQKQMHDA
ncbi:MAG: FGGY family carbohydrate kinase [Oscillospiraceae bacterium]|nr:FGGY family carbohydrate kinase [Oscillospiraceae bacterium]